MKSLPPPKILIFIIAFVFSVIIVIGGIFGYINNKRIDTYIPPVSQLERSPEVPANWKLLEARPEGYWLYYSPSWTIDPSLEESTELKAFWIGDSASSDGLYIISAIKEPTRGTLEYLDVNFANAFRQQTVQGTLIEEKVGVQGRDAISLEGKITNVQTKEIVNANLLLISAKDGKPAYAISAVLRNNSMYEKYLQDILLMTISLRFF